MSFPVIGVIAPELAISQLIEPATRLGVEIKGSSKSMNADELKEFAKNCTLICIEPELISIGAIKVAEQTGVQIYPSSKLLSAISTIELHKPSSEQLAITAARSAHAQSAIWPIALVNKELVISPAPGMGEEQAITIAVSALNLLNELGVTGGIELIVDAENYQNLIGINWLQPISAFVAEINSTTNYFEQYLRAVLDLPMGETNTNQKSAVTGRLKTDPTSNDYRPYLHLMARNPRLKFDQRMKLVGIAGENLEELLTEIIHAQQYYSGEIDS
jgi:phosphoribosylaminoimidazole carboxylase (NCAIR synthetase)